MAHVVLASEDVILIAQFANTIEAEGHTVSIAATGLDAYTTTTAEQPQLVLLDEDLPDHSALATAELIRNDPQSPQDVPILILSADDIDRGKLDQVGATAQFPRDSPSVSIRDTVLELIGHGDSA